MRAAFGGCASRMTRDAYSSCFSLLFFFRRLAQIFTFDLCSIAWIVSCGRAFVVFFVTGETWTRSRRFGSPAVGDRPTAVYLEGNRNLNIETLALTLNRTL